MRKQTSNKFSPEVRSRAVRLVLDHEHEHPSPTTPAGLLSALTVVARSESVQAAAASTVHHRTGPPPAVVDDDRSGRSAPLMERAARGAWRLTGSA